MERKRILAKDNLPILKLLLIPILLNNSSLNTGFASAASSFSLQGIDDDINDWSLANTNSSFGTKDITHCTIGQHTFSYPDIAAVNYYSDGKTLNAILWLSSPFKEPSLNLSSSSPFIEIARRYVMLIHIDSVYGVGQDYDIRIDWNPVHNIWTRTIQLSSLTAGENKKFDPWENKLIRIENYTDFFERGKNYVELNVDLDAVSNPSQYSIVSYAMENFFTKDYRFSCNLVDITDSVHIPPPEFDISASQSSVVLRPGEEKNIELQIKSNTKLNSHVSFSTNTNDGLDLTFIPNQIFVYPLGLSISKLHIKALENAEQGIHTVPISSYITFPTTFINLLSEQRINNNESASIIKPSNFTITILPPLRPDEYLNNFYNAWLSPISGIWTFLAGVAVIIAPLIIRTYNRKNKNKKISDWFNHGK